MGRQSDMPHFPNTTIWELISDQTQLLWPFKPRIFYYCHFFSPQRRHQNLLYFSSNSYLCLWQGHPGVGGCGWLFDIYFRRFRSMTKVGCFVWHIHIVGSTSWKVRHSKDVLISNLFLSWSHFCLMLNQWLCLLNLTKGLILWCPLTLSCL